MVKLSPAHSCISQKSNDGVCHEDAEQNLHLLPDDGGKKGNRGRRKVRLILKGWNDDGLCNGHSKENLKVEDVSGALSDHSETFSDIGNP